MTASVDWSRFPRTLALIEGGGARGLHSGAQLHVRHGKTLLFSAAWGEAREGLPMRTDTLMTWLSSSKPVAAVAIGRLWEEKRLALDQKVSELIPEFAQGSKDAITVEHLLTHTCGFRSADAMWNRNPWAENVARACAAPLEPGWVPGETAGYQLSASWFVLGEIVARLTGQPFAAWVRQEIFLPLGMNDCALELSAARYRDYEEAGRIGWLHSTALGRNEPHRFWDSAEGYALCWPGSSGHGPMAQLALLYEMLAAGGTHNGARILRAETVAELTRRRRVGLFDKTFRHTLDWGLGLIVDSKQYETEENPVPYGFGKHASERTFGHSGAQSSCAFHDPEHDLVAAWIVNGMAGDEAHRPRARGINSAIYEDLGLA
ncbi:MAG TPA: serine hydrolase domain-containing protein [Candidatus Methylacidiphilales bacterium]